MAKLSIADVSWSVIAQAKTPQLALRGDFQGVKYDKHSIRSELRRCFPNEPAADFTAATPRGEVDRAVLKLARLVVAGNHPQQLAKQQPEQPVVANAKDLTLEQALVKAYGADANERDAWVNKLIKAHGHRLACEIANQDAVDAIAAELYPIGKPATRKRQVYVPIKRAFAVCKVAAVIDFPKGHDDYRHGNFLKQGDELHGVLDILDRKDEEFGLLCEVLAYTPSRRKEIMNLRVFRIDFNARTIYLPGIGKENRTKTGDQRTITLTDRLFARLQAHCAGKQGDDYVFRFRSTGGAFTRKLHSALKEAGVFERLDPRHRGFHLLRHTYATGMRQLGVNLVETGGWATEQAAKRYDHHVSEAAKRVAELPSRPVAAPVTNVVAFPAAQEGTCAHVGDKSGKAA